MTEVTEYDEKDVSYALNKLGVDMGKIKQERLEVEEKARLKAEAERKAATEKTRRERAERADKIILADFGKWFFVTVDQKRLTKLKAVDDLNCPHCGVAVADLTNTIRDFALNESSGCDVMVVTRAQASYGNIFWRIEKVFNCGKCNKTFVLWAERLRKPSS